MKGALAASPRPATIPLPQPQRTIRRVRRRVLCTSPLPSALPVILAVRAAGPSDSASRDVVVLWLAFTVFMVVRGVGLGWRARRDDWMVVGAR